MQANSDKRQTTKWRWLLTMTMAKGVKEYRSSEVQ